MTSLSGSLAGSVAGPLSGLAEAAPPTIEDILGDMLVEYWDAGLGITLVGGEVDSWAGQVRGTLLSAPSASQRPAFGPDGSHFGGHPVVQTDATGTRVLVNQAISPPILPAGSGFYVAVIGRIRAFTNPSRFFTFASADRESGISVMSDGVGSNWAMTYVEPPLTYFAAPEPPDFLPHYFEALSSTLEFAIDAALQGTNSNPALLTQDWTQLMLGCAVYTGNALIQFGNASLGRIVIASGRPSAAQRAALFELLGTPPGALFVSAGGSIATADGGQIVGGF